MEVQEVMMIKGKKVTGFSNAEEEQVGLAEKVPFLLEDRLVKLGGLYEKAEPWHVHAVADENLITGQNPQSSEATADLILAGLK